MLNSVFLHECVEAGLDSAIVHAGKIVPLNRIARRAARGLPRPRSTTAADPATTRCSSCSRCSPTSRASKTEKEDRSGLAGRGAPASTGIIDGDRDGLTADLDEALAGGIAPLSIVNDVLLDGMRVVGELFGSGQMQLPFVLQSAETMKTAVAYLEPHMERVGG